MVSDVGLKKDPIVLEPVELEERWMFIKQTATKLVRGIDGAVQHIETSLKSGYGYNIHID